MNEAQEYLLRARLAIKAQYLYSQNIYKIKSIADRADVESIEIQRTKRGKGTIEKIKRIEKELDKTLPKEFIHSVNEAFKDLEHSLKNIQGKSLA